MESYVGDNSFWGAVYGASARLTPEFLKIINKLIDNNHELKMIEKSSAIETNTTMSKVEMHNAPDYGLVDRIIQVQNTKSGNKKIDFINILVRPSTTYALVGSYLVLKFWWYSNNITAKWSEVWTPDDITILASILAFWFLGRVLDRKQ